MRVIFTKNPPTNAKRRYTYKTLTQNEIYDLVSTYIPKVNDSFNPGTINKWFTSEGSFGAMKSSRQEDDIVKVRNIWVMNLN